MKTKSYWGSWLKYRVASTGLLTDHRATSTDAQCHTILSRWISQSASANKTASKKKIMRLRRSCFKINRASRKPKWTSFMSVNKCMLIASNTLRRICRSSWSPSLPQSIRKKLRQTKLLIRNSLIKTARRTWRHPATALSCSSWPRLQRPGTTAAKPCLKKLSRPRLS